jgi:hypothetical protein
MENEINEPILDSVRFLLLWHMFTFLTPCDDGLVQTFLARGWRCSIYYSVKSTMNP